MQGVGGSVCRLRWIALAGAIFGLSLNFRSDGYLLALIIAAILLWLVWPEGRARAIRCCCLWLAATYSMLAPWMVYTYSTIGAATLTSTNGGHVLFMGLGQLPGNKWGLTADDGDLRMHELLARHFGEPRSSYTYESDVFLKRSFVDIVQADTGEYIKKCSWNMASFLLDGFYAGVFDPAHSRINSKNELI